MAKTAMADLLEKCISMQKDNGYSRLAFKKGLCYAFGMVQEAIEKQLLEQEKQQIIDAFVAGMEFIPADPKHYQSDSEQYYNETYKQ